MPSLETLPVELLYEVQLYALSVALPITSRRLRAIFNSSPASFRAQYILGHLADDARLSDAVSTALRFPLCAIPVVDAVLRAWPPDPVAPTSDATESQGALLSEGEEQGKVEPEPEGGNGSAPAPRARPAELPKRLFRALGPRTDREYRAGDAPLPLLRYLYAAPRLTHAPPDADSHAGYALTRAVHAEHVPLVRLLLDHGASPAHKRGLAVLVAIRRKQLSLVRMLIERTDAEPGAGKGGKKRRLEDRVEVTPEMLKTAVKAKARDIAEYFMEEKGCVPDMQTLQMLVR
ncbi:hypothetical protein B0H15DRAFT_960329 [Mycena belliarum]|uniref:Uncharacterized protein n=1 Tax=Mycena belliarum TaxID=1033014 RepID=A0AAD6XWP4_9AGAR|nr:hypothetical protein B0H15DRAFT_960329 [Mycena belliae]